VRLYELSRGIDNSQVVGKRPARSLSAEDTFERDVLKVQTVSPLRRTVTATNGIQFGTVPFPASLSVLIVPPIWHRSRTDLIPALNRLRPILGYLPELAKHSGRARAHASVIRSGLAALVPERLPVQRQSAFRH
jgi:hypothetical protein